MASERRSVWETLRRLGHRGDRDRIRQTVLGATSELVDLAEVFDEIGATRDWPECGSAEWRRLRAKALRIVVSRLARCRR